MIQGSCYPVMFGVKLTLFLTGIPLWTFRVETSNKKLIVECIIVCFVQKFERWHRLLHWLSSIFPVVLRAFRGRWCWPGVGGWNQQLALVAGATGSPRKHHRARLLAPQHQRVNGGLQCCCGGMMHLFYSSFTLEPSGHSAQFLSCVLVFHWKMFLWWRLWADVWADVSLCGLLVWNTACALVPPAD